MRKIRLKEEAEIIRRFSYLLSSGQGMVESILLLERTYPALSLLSSSIRQGKSLTASLKVTSLFSPLSVKMIEVGEMTGTLARSLSHVADHLRHSYEIKSKIMTACMYHLLVLCLASAIVMFLIGYILPKITPIFESMHVVLPFSTRLLLHLSHFFSHNLLLLIFFFGSIIVVLLSLRFIPHFKRQVQDIFFHLPGIKKLSKLSFLISLFRSLGIMLQAGIGIIHALSLIQESEQVTDRRSMLHNFISYVEKGRLPSAFLGTQSAFFPEEACQFIKIGEATGNLSASCLHFSEYLEYDFLHLIKRLMYLLEPFLMICIGFVVGFIALSLLSPLYELSRISSV